MKYIFTLLLAAISFGCFAQGSASGQRYINNNAGYIVGKKVAIADTAGSTTDTIKIRPQSHYAYYKLTATDSCSINLVSTAGLFDNDFVIIDVETVTATSFLWLAYSKFIVSTGTAKITLTATKRSKLIFSYDSKSDKLIEISRNLNYTP